MEEHGDEDTHAAQRGEDRQGQQGGVPAGIEGHLGLSSREG
jgi:hypothetical protein